MPFYAVAKGKKPGVYQTWNDCKTEVDGFVGARFRKFPTIEEAEAFVSGSPGVALKSSTRAKGRPHPYAAPATGSHSAAAPESTRASVSSTSSKKKPVSYYAVAKGHKVGVFETWDECQTHIKGFKGPQFKKFSTREEALEFVGDHSSDGASSSTTAPPSGKELVAGNSILGLSSKTARHANVYTDGACEMNGSKGANGGIGVYWGPNDPRNVSEPLTGRMTNNRAEIHAAIRAVNQAKEQGFDSLTVHTDSQFMIDSMTKWLKGWKKRDWQLSSGGPVKNKDDFQELEEAMEGVVVKWNKVKGHSGLEGNDEADRLAVEGINRAKVAAKV